MANVFDNFILINKLVLRADKQFQSEIKRACLKRVLPKNKSYISVLIGGKEIFLGEINRDLSQLPICDLGFMYDVADVLRVHIETSKELSDEAFKKITENGDWCFRYIVHPSTEGRCLSWNASVSPRDTNTHWVTFGYVTTNASPGVYGTEWLEYWNDRKSYFAN